MGQKTTRKLRLGVLMKKFVSFFLCLFILIPSSPAFAEKQIPILIYHSIDEYKEHGPKDLYVTPENFEKQMIYLRDHGFTLLTFERWEDIHRVNKPIFLTFDDGYKNNVNVFTTFKKLETKNFKPAGTLFVISDFIGRFNRLSQTDLKMMADSGLLSIQSHTATHPDLTKINDYEHELKLSKEKIQKITGQPVIALAYPYGKFNGKVISETKKYYKFGIATIPEPFIQKGTKDELYKLPRIYIKYSTTLDEFAEIVEGK